MASSKLNVNLYRLYLMRQITSIYNVDIPLMSQTNNKLSGKLNTFHVLNISFVLHALFIHTSNCFI